MVRPQHTRLFRRGRATTGKHIDRGERKALSDLLHVRTEVGTAVIGSEERAERSGKKQFDLRASGFRNGGRNKVPVKTGT